MMQPSGPAHQSATRAVLFDLDGTLLDTAQDFAAVLNAMREQRDHPPLPFSNIRQTVSEGARALVRLGFDLQPGDAGFDDLHRELLHRYEAHLSRHSSLFAGVDDVLRALEAQHLPWGIVTNKPSRYTDAILDDLALSERCAVAICPDHVSQTKPHPEPIHLACRHLGCSAMEAIYVGDHRRDIEAGNNATALTLAVTWGYAAADDPPQDWGANAIIDRPADILGFIAS